MSRTTKPFLVIGAIMLVVLAALLVGSTLWLNANRDIFDDQSKLVFASVIAMTVLVAVVVWGHQEMLHSAMIVGSMLLAFDLVLIGWFAVEDSRNGTSYAADATLTLLLIVTILCVGYLTLRLPDYLEKFGDKFGGGGRMSGVKLPSFLRRKPKQQSGHPFGDNGGVQMG